MCQVTQADMSRSPDTYGVRTAGMNRECKLYLLFANYIKCAG